MNSEIIHINSNNSSSTNIKRNYLLPIFLVILFITGLIVFQDAFRTYFTHEFLSCYLVYFTFADDFYIPECFYSNAFGHFPEYFIGKKGIYRPLLTCSFALDYLVWGYKSYGYRLTTYLFHFVNAMLVILLGKVLLRNTALATIAGLLFFFHPWNVSPIQLLIQRAGVICAFFYMLSILLFLNYRGKRGNSQWWLIGLVLSSTGAIMTYEMAITLPVMLFLTDVLILAGNKKPRGWWKIHACLFLALAVYIVFRVIIFHGVGGYPGPKGKSPHLMLNSLIISNYINYIDGFFSMYLSLGRVFIPILIIATVASIFVSITGKYFIFWVLITLSPIINIGMNTYYFYLPSIGAIFFMVGVLGILGKFLAGSRNRGIILAIVSIIMVFMSLVSIEPRFHQQYKDNMDTLKLVRLIHGKYPDLANNTVIYMVIPRLIGHDYMDRNYFDISMEHLLQLEYHDRTLRCFPLPVEVKHWKYSDPGRIRASGRSLFLRRTNNGIEEIKNVNGLIHKLRSP